MASLQGKYCSHPANDYSLSNTHPKRKEKKFSSNHQLSLQVIFVKKNSEVVKGNNSSISDSRNVTGGPGLTDAFLFIPLHQHPALTAEATDASPKACWKGRKRHQTPHGVLEIHNPEKLLRCWLVAM